MKCRAADNHRPELTRQPYMMFRCPRCKHHVCGFCHGTHEGDATLDRLCDDCWSNEMRRRERRAA